MRLFDYARASTLMDELGIDLVLVSSPENTGYLADYNLYINDGHPFVLDGTELWTGRMVGLPKAKDKAPFIAAISFEETLMDHFDVWIRDRRYFGPQMFYQGHSEKRVYSESFVECVVEAIRERGLAESTIAVDMAFMAASYYVQLRQLLPRATFVDAEPLLWKLRVIKSPEEIRRIRKAAQATDTAVDVAYAACHEGMTELEFQRILKQTMVQEGTDYAWSSVAFGPKGALLVLATEERLRPGEVVRVDACARYQGYISDISRVRVFGEPSDEARRAHEAIYTANRMLAESARPGVRCCDLYHMVMDHLEKAGYESLSPQAGHGLGRDAHEPPMLAAWNEMVLEPNMVVVFEPTMRVVGVGSINVEDMVVITEDGNEPLTTSVRELVPCGVAST
jgi:Xaa-Pro aminopeptidase